MMLPYRRLFSIGAVLGGLAALLAIVIGLTIQRARTDVALLGEIRQARAVLNGVLELKLTLLRAETGQRGFLLTGKPDDLAPFLQARQRLGPVEADLIGLLGRDPPQQDIFRRLLPAIGQKMAEMDATLRARASSGKAASLRIMTSDVDQHLTGRILATLDLMQSGAERMLTGRRADFDRARASLAYLAVAGALLAILCLAAGGWMLRRFSRRIRRSETLYRLLAQNMNDVIVRLDLDGRRIYVSPSSTTLCGYDAAEMLGGNLLDLAHPDDVATLDRQYGRLASGRADTELMTFRFRHKDGHHVWVESSLSLIRDDDGNPEGVVASLRDISSRKVQSDELRAVNLELERLARHLAKARDRAEQASSAKTRFLAGMSHELRTPLNGIIGYAHLLRLEGGLTDAQEARVSSMLSAGEHLLGMINHVLDLSEIESEHVDLRTSEVHLAETARACLALVKPAAEQKALDLRLLVDPRSPRMVVADPARLRQVLLNLLGNAVKFTEAGLVELRLLPGSGGAARIEVADTGPGIPAGQSHRLFGEFERLHSGEATVEGAGLGLAISARLAALMGGQIGYADNQGGGSLFWLELPPDRVCEPTQPAAELPKQGKRRLRVLVADDVAMNRDIAQAFLRAAGHETVVVDGGFAAIDAVAAGGFDAVLMDVRMPDIDGLEAARRIRALPSPACSVPIVALTAQAFSEQVEECRTAGMNGHLSKPFAPDALLLAIERAVAMDPASLADASKQDAEIAGLAVFDRMAFGHTARYLESGSIEPYLQTIAERGGSLLGRLRLSPADGLDLAASAHDYAGSAGMFGFSRSAELARRFERAVQTASPDAGRVGRQLADAIASTLPEITRLLQPSASSQVEVRGRAPNPTKG